MPLRVWRLTVRWLPIPVLVCLALALSSQADPGEDVLKKLTIPPAPVLTGADAINSFRVAPGFRIELVAAEPLIQRPVQIVFGPDGRLWAVEMAGYMPDADGKGESDPVGRIVVLEDTDGDGKMDKRTVFLDGLVLPRALALVGDGVLVIEDGKLSFCRDTDGDGKCDEKTLLCNAGNRGSPEYNPNGLLQAIDNWIYCAQFGTRIRRTADGVWLKEPTASRGQWGLSQDDAGRLYYNGNSTLLRGDLMPCWSPNAHVPNALTNQQLYREQETWPARVTPGINRYFQLRADGKLKSVTAACGPCIFRGDNLPAEVRGNAFICEPAGNLVKRNILFEDKGKPSSRNAYDKAEFLASTDERFRPVNTCNGPDGCLYVVDLYHGILQHKNFLTPYLKKQVLDRGLDKPAGLGRIYRVVHESSGPRKPPALAKATSAELVKHLSHPNGWWRDTAQRLLVERADRSVVTPLRELAESGESPVGRLHALWTLEGMNRLDPETLSAALADKSAPVRSAAAAQFRRLLKSPPDATMVAGLAALAADESREVRMQLAFTLGHVGGAKVEDALGPLLREAGDNPALLDGLLAGFAGREAEFVAMRLQEPGWAKREPWRERLLRAVGSHLFSQRNPVGVLKLLHVAAAQPPEGAWRQAALLEGLAAGGIVPKGKAPQRPMKLPTPAEALDAMSRSPDAAVKAAAAALSERLIWPGKDGKPLPVPPPLSTEHQALYDRGRKEYLGLCAQCHHPLGYGEAGKAPALLDSDWLKGPEQRLIRMVLHGVRGPITVDGALFNADEALEMPASANALNDEQIAAVLTYARREWGEFAKPVEPAAVQSVRAATKDRQQPWTEKELLKLK